MGHLRWLPLDLARGMSSSESPYEDMAGDVDESTDSRGWYVLCPGGSPDEGGWTEGRLRYSVVRKEREVKVSAEDEGASRRGPSWLSGWRWGQLEFFFVWWKLAVGSERCEDIDGPKNQRE